MAIAVLTSVLRKKFPEKLRINILNLLLWGGVLGLALEHLAHGEIVPYPPFLTAGLEHVIPEMLTVGVPMTMAISGTWALMVSTIEGPLGRFFRLGKFGAMSAYRSQK